MKITVRKEQPSDYRKVEEVAREAFWNLYVPGCEEHLVIHKMRNHKDFIKELGFVVEVDGEVMGSIFYTKSKIVTPDGTEIETASFGPVNIHPSLHRKGVGRELITYAIEETKKLGYRAILTLGYDYHYKPYGFKSGKAYGITMPDGNFYKGLLVLPLYEGALDNISGYAMFSDIFELDPEEVETYDRHFEPKEKLVLPSQEEFAKASIMLDE